MSLFVQMQVPYADWLDAPGADIRNTSTMHDAWILDPGSLGDVVAADAVVDLSSLVLNTPGLQWSSIVQFYR